MDVSTYQPSTSNRLVISRLPVRVATWVVGVAACGLFLLSLFLLVRRLGGAFQRPLSPPALIVTAIILAAVATTLHLLWLRSAPTSWKRQSASVWLCLPSLALLILGASVSLPGSSTAALVLFWGILLGSEATAYLCVRYLGRDTSVVPECFTASPQPAPDLTTDTTGTTGPAAGSDYPPAEVSQQLVRASDASGHESVHALLRGSFAPGQRSLSLHVAFCPPLVRTPEIHARQLEGEVVRIKVAQVMPYGARLDLRLQVFSQRQESVLIELRTQN